jgi:two-component system, chemotaxis family, CheB/CheR fusion protein
LRSTNEELQSVNEELQSSNEELKTSKEELQSTNEELTTVNAELQHKVDELSHVNNDINNLLASTEIGTIFLDIHLHIKRFTPAVKKIFNLIQSDIDRPINDITSNLYYDAVSADAKSVLDTLNRKELEIVSSEGRWYSIRIAPYRTMDNIIDGVVITFVDITTLKQAQIAQQNAMLYAQSIVDTVRQPLVVLDAELRVQSANRAFYRTFHLVPADTEQQRIYDVGDQQWDLPELRHLLEHIIPDNESFDDYEVKHDIPTLGVRTMRLNARRIRQTDQPDLILLAIEEVTEKELRDNMDQGLSIKRNEEKTKGVL